jgi:hypothetical protein
VWGGPATEKTAAREFPIRLKTAGNDAGGAVGGLGRRHIQGNDDIHVETDQRGRSGLSLGGGDLVMRQRGRQFRGHALEYAVSSDQRME